jgi:hypothetical protein
MKKIIAMIMVLVTGIIIANPSMSYGRVFDSSHNDYKHVAINNHSGRYSGPSRPYNNVRYERSNDNNNVLYFAGAALGGIILGTVLGITLSQPADVTTRQTVYNIPAPGPQAYAQPYNYGPSYNQDTPPGQWVTVQGQWVNGQWIPAHNIRVPVNP